MLIFPVCLLVIFRDSVFGIELLCQMFKMMIRIKPRQRIHKTLAAATSQSGARE